MKTPSTMRRLIAAICALPTRSRSRFDSRNEIAKASPRLLGLRPGVEDYATSMGVAATSGLLRPAVYQLIQAARAAGLHA